MAGDASRWLDGRLRTLAGVGSGQINLDFYGAGLGRPEFDRALGYSLGFAGGVAQANWQLAPKSPWAVGLRYVFANVDPKPRDASVFPGAADERRVTICAPAAVVEYDSRDSVFTPTRGLYAETSYLVAREAFASSAQFERFEQIVLGWRSLRHDVTLGARANYAWASEDTPFFLKPFIQLRGVPAMRYQGYQVASVELEARWQFFGRWSLVPCGGVGATRVRGIASSDGRAWGAAAAAVATSWPASSGCTPASTSRAAPEPPRCIFRSVMRGSGLGVRRERARHCRHLRARDTRPEAPAARTTTVSFSPRARS